MRARNLYIYVGNDNISILRGYDLTRYEGEKGVYYKGKIKHRGIFSSYFPVVGLPDYCIGEPKNLFVKNKILSGWKATVIKVDFLSHEPYIPDLPTKLVVQLESLRIECNKWKQRCFEAESKLITMEGKDRFSEKIKETLKFASEARNLSSSFGGYDGGIYGGLGYGGYGGFGSRWLGGGLGGGIQSQSKEE